MRGTTRATPPEAPPAFGAYGGDWASGEFYVVRVASGANGPQIVARTVLEPCLAVYADQGAVWVEGPAC